MIIVLSKIHILIIIYTSPINQLIKKSHTRILQAKIYDKIQNIAYGYMIYGKIITKCINIVNFLSIF